VKSNGSRYVAVVITALLGYFAYQTWFNPYRIVKRRLGELAATLSVPATDTPLDRVTRLARLPYYFAENVRVRVGQSRAELTSRDAVLAALGAWTPPPGGAAVAFVDTQVNVLSSTTARATMTVEVTSRDPGSGNTIIDTRYGNAALVKQDVGWVISDAELAEPPTR
jgi:SnoaL-like domain